MDQHPVPQQISSYEFRLVGDMTLKQFFQVAGGIVVAFIFYASGLPSYFKWPLILFSAFLGIALAFLPFEERPLQTWIFAFFKAVYSPTQYLWQKKPKKPEFLEARPVRAQKMTPPPILPDQRKLIEYLKTLPAEKSPLDQKEEGFLNQVNHLFSTPLPQNLPVEEKPKPQEAPAAEEIIARYQYPAPLKPLVKLGRPPGSPTKPAEFAPEATLPSISSIPNVLVGMVKDKEGKIVEGAIMEIKDEQGNPVRALRTNKLGQFRIATPLSSGIYEIQMEKEGLKFDLIKITLTGNIVQPIEIKAKQN